MKESEGDIAEAADILQVQTGSRQAGRAVQTAGRQYTQQQAVQTPAGRQAGSIEYAVGRQYRQQQAGLKSGLASVLHTPPSH
jgi:hypothetical protein